MVVQVDMRLPGSCMLCCTVRALILLSVTEVPGAALLTEAEASLQRARDKVSKIQCGIIHYAVEFVNKDGQWFQRGSARRLVFLTVQMNSESYVSCIMFRNMVD